MIEYRILGSLEVCADGRLIEVRGARLRSLLVILLLRANQSVPRDVLLHELWGEQPPAGAQHSLDVYISRLRKALDPPGNASVVVTRPGGYSIQLTDGQLDVNVFERLAEGGRNALSAQAPDEAADKLRAALSVWRGSALADVSSEPYAQLEIARLEELRLGALENRIESDLALGRHAEVVGELRALVVQHPLREAFRGHLMIALYRSGRQAEALAAYQAARQALIEELGLDPGPELRSLERAILQQDEALDRPAGPAAAVLDDGHGTRQYLRDRQLRRQRLFAVAGALTLAIGLVVTVAARGSARLSAGPDTVGAISTGEGMLTAVVKGIGRPSGVAYGAGAVWITDSADDRLLQVSSAGQVIDRIPVGRGPAGVTVGDDEVWVANQLDGTVSEVNPGSGTQVATIGVGVGPSSVAFGFGSVWVANVTDDTLSRIDAASGDVISTIELGTTPADVATGAGAVWVTCGEIGELLRISPVDDRPSQAIPIGPSPDGLAVGAGDIWVADTSGVVSRFDPRTGKVRTITIGGQPSGVAFSDGGVWVTNSLSGSIARIDPATGAARSIQIGNEPTDITVAGHDVWATVLPSLASHRGGTLTVIAFKPPDEISPVTDPAVAYFTLWWQMLGMTNDGLVSYRHVTGLAGAQLVPDLATALPVPTDDGRTYTFRLRSGIRYSTGALVKPADFRRAIERVFVIGKRHDVGILPFYAGIEGASQCERESSACDLAHGIVANDKAGTVTFHLTAPDPEFLYKLAFSWADAVPAGTPDHVISAAQLPATGPYMTQSVVPSRSWVLVRNPRFREWSQDAQPGGFPDKIILKLGLAPAQAIADVENGDADVLLSPPAQSTSQLATHYASQLHIGPLAATIALTLNTHTAPFSKLAARQAVNDAIDRSAVIALNGGPLAARPTCQILPPTMLGYQPYCPYTLQPSPSGAWLAPDIARAERLVRASGTQGERVVVLYSNEGMSFPSPATGRYVVSVLDQLGYRASLRVVRNPDTYWGLLGNSHNHAQAGFFSWYEDYPAPPDFIEPLLTCSSFVPDSPGNINTAEFCDPKIDAQADRVLTSRPANVASDAGDWAAVDRELVDQAPWAPLYNPRNLVLLGRRVGNYQFHPFWNVLLDELWVR